MNAWLSVLTALPLVFASAQAVADDRCLAVLETGRVVGLSAERGQHTSERPVRHLWCWSPDKPPRRLDPMVSLAEVATDSAPEPLTLRVRLPADGPCRKDVRALAAPVAMWREVPEGQLPAHGVSKNCSVEILRNPGEAWRVRVVGPGIGSWWIEVSAAARQVVVPLREAESAEIGVVDGDGRAIEHAGLDLLERRRGEATRNVARFDAGARGIEIPALPSAHPVMAFFRAPGFVGRGLEGLPAALPREVVLVESASLSGRFVDADDQPVAGVSLTAEAWVDGSASVLVRRRAASDAAGRWRLEDLPYGDVVLAAGMDGFAAFRRALVLEVGSTDLGTITLPLESLVTVAVVDPDGVPVGGATVAAGDGPEVYNGPEVFTDASGMADLRGLPPARPVALVVDADGFQRAETLVPKGADMPFVVTLRPAFEITGRFVDTHGAGVAGARVQLVAGKTTRTETVTEGGTFRIELPPRTPVEVRFISPRTRRLVVHVEPGEPGELRDLGDLRAPPGRAAVGRVVDARDAAPVVGARVLLPRPSANNPLNAWFYGDHLESITDAEGRFRLEGLDARSVEIRVEASEFALARFRVPKGADNENAELGDLALSPGATVEVEADAALSLSAVARLDLVGRWLESDMLTAPVSEGGARFEHVPAGRATLSILDGRQLVCEETVDVPPGPEVVTARCRDQALRVDGLVEVAGEPAGRGRLAWLPETTSSPSLIVHQASPLGLEATQAFGGGPPEVDVEVDASGYFQTDELRAGRWDVVWLPDGGGRSHALAVTLAPSRDSVTVDLAFPGHRIEGRVVDLSGEPVDGARVRELRTGAIDWSRPDGTFRLVGSAPGTYHLRADAGREESETKQVQVVDERPVAAVELVLGTRDREESLVVLAIDPDEQPIGGAFVFLETEAGGTRVLTTDGSGRAVARFDPPFPERVRLAGWAHGRWLFGGYRPYADVIGEPVVMRWSVGGTLVLVSEDAPQPVGIVTATNWDLSALMTRLGQVPVAAPSAPLVIEGLPPGIYRLATGKGEWQPTAAQDDVVEVVLGE